MFQFLIGAMKGSRSRQRFRGNFWFQFLIGAMKAGHLYVVGGYTSGFNSL